MKTNNETNNENITGGWEYLTDINPNNAVTEQKLQNTYLMNYNLSYHRFINSICIEKDTLKNIVKEISGETLPNTNIYNTRYQYIIDIEDENDIINKDDDFPIKFLKSKFLAFKLKKIKTDLISHYKPLGFYVKGPNELRINEKINKYYIEICWKNDNN